MNRLVWELRCLDVSTDDFRAGAFFRLARPGCGRFFDMVA